jgi:hypothetical protein
MTEFAQYVGKKIVLTGMIEHDDRLAACDSTMQAYLAKGGAVVIKSITDCIPIFRDSTPEMKVVIGLPANANNQHGSDQTLLLRQWDFDECKGPFLTVIEDEPDSFVSYYEEFAKSKGDEYTTWLENELRKARNK